MTTLRVEAVEAGRKRAGGPARPLVVSLPEGPTTLGELIEAVVRAEVSAFVDRAADRRLVRVLTEADIADGLAAGAVSSGGSDVAAEVDPDAAVATALDAQRDGLFQTIVDDEPIDGLDEVLVVGDGTSVMFLRLVPLVGG